MARALINVPPRAKVGDIIEIKTLVSHPMETGYRVGLGGEMIPRDIIENESATAIRPMEAVDEKVSLSDRFGLWLGFHPASQDDYFEMLDAYVARYRISVRSDDLRAQAVEWAATRGARSGRTAWQFIQDLAGRLGKQTG
jgi:predicted AAA+ superfamily ATPase